MGMRGGPRVAFVPAVSMLHHSFNGGPRGASRLMLPVASASAQFAPEPKTHVPLQLEASSALRDRPRTFTKTCARCVRMS